MNIPKYDLKTCEAIANKINVPLKTIMEELNDFLKEYADEFILYYLANKSEIDVVPNEVECTYTSVWDGEGSITSNAIVNLNTRKVTILEDVDYWDILTEDGEPFECEQLENEYITIDGVDYPCHNINDDGIWDDVDCWTKETSYWYE